MHAAFGIIMGYYVGKAKFQRSDRRNDTAIIGLACAVFLSWGIRFLLVSERVRNSTANGFSDHGVGVLFESQSD